MKNVTITLGEDVARWARLEAARQGISVSRLVGEMLQEKMKRAEGHRAARDQFFSVGPRRLREDGEAMPRREEFYDRSSLR